MRCIYRATDPTEHSLWRDENGALWLGDVVTPENPDMLPCRHDSKRIATPVDETDMLDPDHDWYWLPVCECGTTSQVRVTKETLARLQRYGANIDVKEVLPDAH